MNKIELVVPLSGSKFFDLNTYVTAKRLCDSFPGLKMEAHDGKIFITGELSDYWMEQYNNKMSELESIQFY